MKQTAENQNDQGSNQLSNIAMLLLAALVGVIAGFGAVAFRRILGMVHNAFFSGHFTMAFNATLHAHPSIWGAGIILVPVIGILMVTFLTEKLAPEAKGHGVPEAVDAIFFKGGQMRARVGVIKCIASAITIGSGGSVGREGPIIQIGASFGALLNRIFKMPPRQCVVLLAAGAGAGIAATFNAPIGGLAFAVELLLVSVRASTIAVVAVSTVTATHIGRVFLGNAPAFSIPALAAPTSETHAVLSLLLFIPLGVLIGLAATIFIRSIYWSEDHFEAWVKNPYLRNGLASLVLGLMLFGFMRYSGHYFVQGVGYSTITDVLSGTLLNPWFLLILFAGKLLATNLTLGGGGSGGVFSPSLFLGATLSAAFGIIVNHFVPVSAQISPALYAVVGMTAMIAATTGAVLTSIIMIFEMTRNYTVILPIMLVVAFAYLVRQYFSKESIYTMKLLRRGRPAHEGLQAALHSAKRAVDVMSDRFQLVDIEKPVQQQTNTERDFSIPQIIHANGKIKGILNPNKTQHAILPKTKADEHKHERTELKYLTVSAQDNLYQILRDMRLHHCQTVLVTDDPKNINPDNIRGIITPLEIAEMAESAAELMH